MKSLYYDGAWQDATNSMAIINPYTGEVIEYVAAASPADAEKVLQSAARGQEAMRRLTTGERSAILHKAANRVEERLDNFARLITAETGKPIRAALKETRRCVNTLRLAAEEAIRLNGETIPFDSFSGGEHRQGYYKYTPLGLIVAITPFNDPLNLVAHKLGPAIAAGNSVILKPAEQAPLVAIKLARILLSAGLPKDGLAVLTGRGADFGDSLITSPEPVMISFTGSAKVAAAIAAKAGVKRLAMELGANSPVIVMADADIDRAAASCVSGAFWASGQNCIGVQRIFVEKPVYAAFRDIFAERTRSMNIGNPMDMETDIGPVISETEAERIMDWCRAAQCAGTDFLCKPVRKGTLVSPVVLDNPPENINLVCHEVFGPVASLFPFSSLDDALEKANMPDHTIHAAVFTNNINTAFHVADELQVAGVMINDSTDYRLDAMPFGGAKRGSMGREGVRFAVREMSQTKVICFALQMTAPQQIEKIRNYQ